MAVDLVSYLESKPKTLGAYLTMLQLRARDLVRFRRNRIVAVAKALLQKHRLSEAAVKEIISQLPADRHSWPGRSPPIQTTPADRADSREKIRS